MKSFISRILFLMLMLSLATLAGCQGKKTEAPKKIKDLEFTVVEDSEVPDELKELIEEKKKEPMKFTYTMKDHLYIVVGYGEQSTGGYSVSVDQLYLTDNSIYIDTNLIGPDKQEMVTQVLTYPYVVVKLENYDKSVVFE